MAVKPLKLFAARTTSQSRRSIAGKRNTATWNWPMPNGSRN